MASSWYNLRSVPICLYTAADYRGSAIRISAGGRLSYRSDLNDKMSSVRPAIYRSGGGTIPPSYSCF
jgi:hypothetical protein